MAVGGSLSATVMVCTTSDAGLPLTSVTFHLIVVVPTGYRAVKAAKSLRTPTGAPTPQLSVAVALTNTVAPHLPASLFTGLSPLVVITGTSLSATVMVCTTSTAGLPLISVTFHLIVVVPTGYRAVKGAKSLRTPAGAPTPQLSVAVALTNTVAPHLPASLLTDLLPLEVITGF